MRRSAARSPRRSRNCRRTGAGQDVAARRAAGFRFPSGRWRRGGGRPARLLRLSAQRPLEPRRGAGAADGGRPSGDGNRDRARNGRQAAARSEAPSSTQLERIRAALADEIMAGKVGADQTATTIFVRIGNLVLFPSGGATVKRSFRADRRQDRRRARPGAGRHSRRRLHRHRSESRPSPSPRISHCRRRAPRPSRRC